MQDVFEMIISDEFIIHDTIISFIYLRYTPIKFILQKPKNERSELKAKP